MEIPLRVMMIPFIALSLFSKCSGNNTTTSPTVPKGGGNMTDLNLKVTVIFGGIINPTICVVGMICNILNLIILTRRRLNSPTATILQGLAVADFMMLLIVAIFNLHFFSHHKLSMINTDFIAETEPFFWTLYYHTFFMPANVFLAASNWCVLFVAMFRFAVVYFPIQSQRRLTTNRIRGAILIIYASAIALNLPDFLSVSIDRSNNTTTPKIEPSGVLSKEVISVYRTVKVFLSVLIPWAICFIVTILLMIKLRRGMNLHSQQVNIANDNDARGNANVGVEQKEMSRMLIIVVFVFLVCQFPSSLIFILDSTNVHDAMTYLLFRIMADFGLLFNAAVNFFLYTLSNKFYRQASLHLLCSLKGHVKSAAYTQTSKDQASNDKQMSNTEENTAV